MKVKDKEKLNNPLKGWQILSAISSMVFHTVYWIIVEELTNKNVNHLNLPFYFLSWGLRRVYSYQYIEGYGDQYMQQKKWSAKGTRDKIW